MPLPRILASLAAILLLASCGVPPFNDPPPDAIRASTGGASGEKGAAFSVGNNSTGEACSFGQDRAGGGNVYCGNWTSEPSARIKAGPAADPASLDALATTSPWRLELDKRLECDPPATQQVLGVPARSLSCRNRTRGFDWVGLVTVIDGHAWFADGARNAIPAMQRAVGVASGRIPKEKAASAEVAAIALAGLAAENQTLSADDQNNFDDALTLATTANRLGQSARAENAYRSMLKIMAKGKRDAASDPAFANIEISLAVNLSNQGKFQEAEETFAEARKIVDKSPDPNSRGRFEHYYAIHDLNQGKDKAPDALLRLARAESLYRQTPGVNDLVVGNDRYGWIDRMLQGAVSDSAVSAVAGLVDVRRNDSWAERMLGDAHKSETDARQAEFWARKYQSLWKPEVQSYVLLSSGLSDAEAGNPSDAASHLDGACDAFASVAPSSRPGAECALRRADQELRLGHDGAATGACDSAIKTLKGLSDGDGVDPILMKPCLTLYAKGAGVEQISTFFVALQLMRDSGSRRFIQQSAANLANSKINPEGAKAQRDLQTVEGDLEVKRAKLAAIEGTTPDAEKARKDLSAQIDDLDTKRKDISAAVLASSPNYGQLLDPVSTLEDVYKVLRPGEAFAQIRIADSDAWTIVLRDGKAAVARVDGGAARIDALVARLRKGVEEEPTAGSTFDMAAAQELYTAVFGSFGPVLDGANAIVVVPSGSLLQIPFSVLLTGPGSAESYKTAPWLVRKMVVSHAVSPASFVLLRKPTTVSSAPKPWIGFGDFDPISPQQASAEFPRGTCGDDATNFAGLPRLPSSRFELDHARDSMGATAADELTGSAFTVASVLGKQGNDNWLGQYRIIHFATHALRPNDLKCLEEPAIVTSAPPGATDRKAALLTASAVQNMRLNADLVVLSACNTGGAAGGEKAEGLSGLFRSFFGAGARDVVISHWETSSNVAANMISTMVGHVLKEGAAAALRTQQLRYLDEVPVAALTHPFYWAPFAVVGQGGQRAAATSAAIPARRDRKL